MKTKTSKSHLGRKSLRQDSNFEHHFLPKIIVCHLQIPYQLPNDHLGIRSIAHRVKQVQGSSPHRDIAVFQAKDNGVLVFLNRF